MIRDQRNSLSPDYVNQAAHNPSTTGKILLLKGSSEMKNEEKKQAMEEETCNPLTDEELKAYQEKDARTTKRVLGFFSAIWDAILLSFS